MKVANYFNEFLKNIEPEKKYKDYASEAHSRVRGYLQTEDSQFSEFVINTFLYGSYKRETAQGNIKDVDIALITNFDPLNEDHRPSKVLPKLKKALTRLYKDAGATDYQRKSVQVIDPLPDEEDSELTLDIIPTVLTGNEDEKLLVPDTETDTWVESHPKGHLVFTSKLNDEEHGKGMFVPLVKIIKHWWSLHSGTDGAKPKGFWLEVLTGYEFDQSKDSYAEHFVSVLQAISERFSNYEELSEVPTLSDPGLPSETLKTSMTLGEFYHFMDAVNDTLAIAVEALDSRDEDQSIYLWNEIFGDEFPISESSSLLDLSQIVKFVELFAPNEQYLTRDFNIPFIDKGYVLTIDAMATQDGFRQKLISIVPLIKKKAKLKFHIARCTVPEPYTIMWKVKNTGKEAARIGQQRGQIILDQGKREREESTLYTGTHFVECYVINDANECVAWDRIKVRIP